MANAKRAVGRMGLSGNLRVYSSAKPASSTQTSKSGKTTVSNKSVARKKDRSA